MRWDMHEAVSAASVSIAFAKWRLSPLCQKMRWVMQLAPPQRRAALQHVACILVNPVHDAWVASKRHSADHSSINLQFSTATCARAPAATTSSTSPSPCVCGSRRLNSRDGRRRSQGVAANHQSWLAGKQQAERQ